MVKDSGQKEPVMTEIVTEKNMAEYEAFIKAHPKGHFMQSSLWAKQKPDWAWAAMLRRNEAGQITGSLAVLMRKLPGAPFTLMYGCRGPVCDMRDTATLDDLIAGAKHLAQTFRSYCIKLDPDVLIGDKDLSAAMERHKFRRLDGAANFEGVQPRFVFRLNIEGKTEEEVLAGFSSKTRYNIRLAERKGVRVENVGAAGLDDFSALMIETGVRDGFVTRPQSYFRAMLENLGERARLYMAYHEGTPIAGTLAIHYGDKVWYLYGASSNMHRNLMPNYLLQWTMICWAIENGCRIYDFRGVSGDLSEDNPLYGLYRFKKGFNGDFCEFIGEFDFVVSPIVYNLANTGRKWMGKIAKRRYMKSHGAPGKSGETETR
ncbi:peptidoglycan bridge formation glycyltransferase FemA/FemB family protein [Oscillospiraceae bacterium OttesenSCG-928-F05]|nr:peptidoglycan bridge formation glycyltransferase FemA/FemB family protein [Oscillospiraceae bacterium OttesenSCG-928-F05]